MLKIRCRIGQSLENYYYDKMILINKCEIKGIKAVGCLIHGIDDKFIRMGAGTCMFKEPEQVLNYLSTLSQNDFLQQNRMKNNKNINNKASNSSNYNRGNFQELRCFNCNETGHISIKCNKPIKKCNFCFKLGHETKDCYKRNLVDDSNNSNKSKDILCINNGTYDKYYKNVHVNGVNTTAYVDLGSKCTLIQESLANILTKE